MNQKIFYVLLIIFVTGIEISAQEIIDILRKQAEQWCECLDADDDLTMMVIKIK